MYKNKFFKNKLKKVKDELMALHIAYKRPDVPLYAKILLLIVLGYAFSPIDLIPDFIPFLGYVDDFIIIPLGISFVIKLIPKNIMDECREESKKKLKDDLPKSYASGFIIICIWILIIAYILKKIL